MIEFSRRSGHGADRNQSQVRWISVDEALRPIRAPEGITFSCNPQEASASDENGYCIKGPSSPVVVAEHVGYCLAALVGLPTPRHALCRVSGREGVHFASRIVRIRTAVEEMLSRGQVDNPEFVAACTAFDTWVANADRNVNNVVAEPTGGHGEARITLMAIDFEKAHVLRGESRFDIPKIDPSKFLPGDALRPFCRTGHHSSMCDRIAAVTPDAIDRVFDELTTAVGPIGWADMAKDVLAGRASMIHRLVKEVFDA